MTSWRGLRDAARYAARLAAVLLVLAGESAILSAATGADNTVRLTVDYGDGVAKTVSDLAWSSVDEAWKVEQGSNVVGGWEEANFRLVARRNAVSPRISEP